MFKVHDLMTPVVPVNRQYAYGHNGEVMQALVQCDVSNLGCTNCTKCTGCSGCSGCSSCSACSNCTGASSACTTNSGIQYDMFPADMHAANVSALKAELKNL
jgi:hypothetical protein